MATYYLPNTVSLVCGSITQTTNPAPEFPAQATIAIALENLKADIVPLEVAGHRIEVVGANSAICWISLRRKKTEWTNVYFFRREEGEGGTVGRNSKKMLSFWWDGKDCGREIGIKFIISRQFCFLPMISASSATQINILLRHLYNFQKKRTQRRQISTNIKGKMSIMHKLQKGETLRNNHVLL
jgi:hypothetical protein